VIYLLIMGREGHCAGFQATAYHEKKRGWDHQGAFDSDRSVSSIYAYPELVKRWSILRLRNPLPDHPVCHVHASLSLIDKKAAGKRGTGVHPSQYRRLSQPI
jgi:hypothetical protein